MEKNLLNCLKDCTFCKLECRKNNMNCCSELCDICIQTCNLFLSLNVSLTSKDTSIRNSLIKICKHCCEKCYNECIKHDMECCQKCAKSCLDLLSCLNNSKKTKKRKK